MRGAGPRVVEGRWEGTACCPRLPSRTRATSLRATALRATALGAVCLSLLAPSCRRRTVHETALAITPTATVLPSRVAAGGPVSVDYRWTLGAAARRLAGPYRAFVHFLDEDGALVWSDEHSPTPAVAEWQAGHSYSYRRTVLTPEFPYAGPVTVVMGLYAPATGERLPLRGEDRGQRRYRVATLSLLPRDRQLALRCEGLYPPEAPVAAPLVVTRFMRREASCRFRNPREDVLVFVQGDLEPAGFATTPVLELSSGGALARRELLRSDELQLAVFRVPARALGREAEATLRLGMNAAYSPRLLGATGDPREVSLRLFRLRVERAGAVDPVLGEGAILLTRPQS